MGREQMLLFELSVVAVHNSAANTELDPVLVLWSLFCCRRHGFSVGGIARAKRADSKSSRTNQHEESASGAHGEIHINISAAGSRWSHAVPRGSQPTSRFPAAGSSSDRRL